MLARAILGKPKLLILDKNSDWLQSSIDGEPPEKLLARFMATLVDCTLVVLAEPDYAAQPILSLFDECYDLAQGELRRG